MGDVVALVEKASEAIEAEEAERMARRMAKGQFDMNDFLMQIRQLQKMGGRWVDGYVAGYRQNAKTNCRRY